MPTSTNDEVQLTGKLYKSEFTNEETGVKNIVISHRDRDDVARYYFDKHNKELSDQVINTINALENYINNRTRPDSNPNSWFTRASTDSAKRFDKLKMAIDLCNTLKATNVERGCHIVHDQEFMKMLVRCNNESKCWDTDTYNGSSYPGGKFGEALMNAWSYVNPIYYDQYARDKAVGENCSKTPGGRPGDGLS